MSFAAIVVYLLNGLVYLIIGDAILSWFQKPEAFPRSLTSRITAPMYAPIHAVLNPRMTGGIDLSPIILIFGLQFLARTLASALQGAPGGLF